MRSINFPCLLKYCIMCLFCVLLSGCITTSPIQKLPISSEAFQSPHDQLRVEYPEIAEYEKAFRGFKSTTLYEKQFIADWGTPDNVKTDWSYAGYMGAATVGCGLVFGPVPTIITAGIVVAIRPYPPEYYYWRKDDYCIEAKFDHTLVGAYRNRLIYWRWHHMSDGKGVPAECRKLDMAGTL